MKIRKALGYRPALYAFLAVLAVACLWIGTQSHRVAAAPPALIRTPQNQSATNDIVDGKVHPELIPDSTAYRLFFLAASTPETTPLRRNQTTHQRAMLHAGRVQSGYADKASAILANFRTQYDALVSEYNSSWYVTHNSTAGLARFLADRDALVQSTRDQLKAALPPETMAALDKYVQQQKGHMRIERGAQ